MDTKLTLKLDEKVITRAKKYASRQKISLSRLIENYLQALTSRSKKEDDEIEISPFVKSITAESSGKLPRDFDYKKEFSEYLEKKYK